ncbi:Arylsulfatase [Pontiella desulfatans]|uniref:Arylsulfatase n=1 Tax=Pontiella desulfatans TaxID=2750659 RepID=A0A6C2UA10_PONDE|nr:arylsulfatase [Pontiella desulfatans]SPS74009.1 sulfatase S1_20 [Kiritimatiellales bacterium]VGO16216.1 Arylsulfatase [Pontiella desulfatans]
MKTTWALLITLGMGCPGGLFAEEAVSEPGADKPNIIFILADDLGYGEVGCYGQEKIKTAGLDRMAAEGLRFTDHYSGYATCTMSRKALMTGRHVGHLPHGTTIPGLTVGHMLQRAGYRTAMIGKWGMTGHPGHPDSPHVNGFDHVFTYHDQGQAHFYYIEFLWRNLEKVHYPMNKNLFDKEWFIKDDHKGVYSHDEFTKEALGFITENKDRPFFLYLPYTIPHAELTVPEDSLQEYAQLGWPETAKEVGGGGSRNPGYGSQYIKGYCGVKNPNATYAAMVTRMDRDIGRILDLLDTLDLSENTLVVFGSDNGASDEGGQSMEFLKSSGALRDGKRSIYEGGTRTPFIVRWTGAIQPGQVTDHMSNFCDFMATACELAGVEAPSHIDSVSYLPTLLGKPEKQKKKPCIYYSWRGHAVRVGDWKLILKGHSVELYNLADDIGETNNLADKMPDKVAELAASLVAASPTAKKHWGKRPVKH